MKSLVFIILTALLSFVSCLYAPWWIIAIVAFVLAALMVQKPGIAFLGAFVAVFLLWFGLSFYLSMNNDHILANRVSNLILKTENPWLLMLMTALIGGLTSGFAALSGSFIYPKRRVEVYEDPVIEGGELAEPV